MVVIDVNTGKFVGKGGNLEETVTRNNLEAAEEIARQLRLRDVGGIIVVDFIDMVLESNRDLVVRRLVECLGRDRTKHQVAEVTSSGLVQMTRKRVGQGLLESFSEPCDACNGRGVKVFLDPVDVSEPATERGGIGERGRKRGEAKVRSEPAEPVHRHGGPALVAAATLRRTPEATPVEPDGAGPDLARADGVADRVADGVADGAAAADAPAASAALSPVALEDPVEPAASNGADGHVDGRLRAGDDAPVDTGPDTGPVDTGLDTGVDTGLVTGLVTGRDPGAAWQRPASPTGRAAPPAARPPFGQPTRHLGGGGVSLV
jgi:ribonuclease E